jgi:hypothetical protein
VAGAGAKAVKLHGTQGLVNQPALPISMFTHLLGV